MIKVNFFNTLQKHTDTAYHIFDIQDLSSLYNGIKNIFPKLDTLLSEELVVIVYNKGEVIPDSWYIRDIIPKEIEELWVIPCIQGGGGKFGKVAIGVALIAAAVFAGGGFGAGGLSSLNFGSGIVGSLGKALLGTGINLVLSALLQQDLRKPPPPVQNDAPARRNNDAFDGLTNTVDTSIPVFLNYGMTRVSGQFISGYIKTVNHGLNDVIEVGTLF